MARKLVIAGLILLALGTVSLAQNGALWNYYPRNFNGKAFSGKVSATDKSNHSITLTADSRRNPVSFTGRFEQNCEYPSGSQEVLWDATELPIGSQITVHYSQKKDSGTTENTIVGLVLHEVNGRAYMENQLYFISCTADKRIGCDSCK